MTARLQRLTFRTQSIIKRVIVSNFRQLLFYGSWNLSFYGDSRLVHVFLIKENSQNLVYAIVCQSRDLLVQQSTNSVYQHPWSRSKFYGLRQYFNYASNMYLLFREKLLMCLQFVFEIKFDVLSMFRRSNWYLFVVALESTKGGKKLLQPK